MTSVHPPSPLPVAFDFASKIGRLKLTPRLRSNPLTVRKRRSVRILAGVTSIVRHLPLIATTTVRNVRTAPLSFILFRISSDTRVRLSKLSLTLRYIPNRVPARLQGRSLTTRLAAYIGRTGNVPGVLLAPLPKDRIVRTKRRNLLNINSSSVVNSLRTPPGKRTVGTVKPSLVRRHSLPHLLVRHLVRSPRLLSIRRTSPMTAPPESFVASLQTGRRSRRTLLQVVGAKTLGRLTRSPFRPSMICFCRINSSFPSIVECRHGVPNYAIETPFARLVIAAATIRRPCIRPIHIFATIVIETVIIVFLLRDWTLIGLLHVLQPCGQQSRRDLTLAIFTPVNNPLAPLFMFPKACKDADTHY